MKSNWIAITGSAGYIGSVLAKHCKQQGYNVLGVDRRYGSSQSSIHYNKFPYVDVALGACISSPDFSSLCQHYDIGTVFHLAASADVELSQRMPFHFYENNIGNTAAMLHNLVNTHWLDRDPKIVYSSTAAVYSECSVPVQETFEKVSPNAYGRSKYLSEDLFEELFRFFKVPSVIFRYFNVAGAYDDVGDALDSHHIIPVLCRAGHSGKAFNLYGVDYVTADGTCVRDFLDVNDVCRAHFHAVQYMETAPGTHIFNLGSKTGTSILNLVKEFEDAVGIDIRYEISDRRNGDPAFLVANPHKFIVQSGFNYTGTLKTMIKSAWDYYCFKQEDKNNGI